MENTAHSSLAAGIRLAKTHFPQIQTTGEKKPGSAARKRIAAEKLSNEHPSGVKFSTVAAAFRIAPLPAGINPWINSAPIAAPRSWWKNRPKNRATFWPVTPRDVDLGQKPVDVTTGAHYRLSV